MRALAKFFASLQVIKNQKTKGLFSKDIYEGIYYVGNGIPREVLFDNKKYIDVKKEGIRFNITKDILDINSDLLEEFKPFLDSELFTTGEGISYFEFLSNTTNKNIYIQTEDKNLMRMFLILNVLYGTYILNSMNYKDSNEIIEYKDRQNYFIEKNYFYNVISIYSELEQFSNMSNIIAQKRSLGSKNIYHNFKFKKERIEDIVEMERMRGNMTMEFYIH